MHDEHLSNGSLELTVATGFGPRITEFAIRDDRNSLAELGEMAIELSCGRAYRMRGGHRLWVAPEVPEITYEPDNDPVAVARVPFSVDEHAVFERRRFRHHVLIV